MKKMKLYITGPENGGDGVYGIIAETGEGLASHMCSSKGFARGDLEANRPERQEKWKEKFGEYEVLFIGDDDMTDEELTKRNKEFHSKKDEENK